LEKQLNIRVFGKVQGVSFRQTCKDNAISLGIKGIVMNEADGSVYISARGDKESLEGFLLFCKTGPFGAEVSNVLVEDVDLQEFSDFSILR